MNSLPEELHEIFSGRKEGFIDSLHQILSAVSTDKYIKQMFDDKLSSNYVPDRVCEIVRFFLNDEREHYVEELLRRLRALETCFGSDRIQQLEDIGQKMLEVSQTQAQKEAEYREFMHILNDQFGGFQNPAFSFGEELQDLKTTVKSLSKSTNAISSTFQNFNSSIKSDFRKYKLQANKYFSNMNSSVQNMSNAVPRLKADNAKLLRQYGLLKDEMEILKESKDSALKAQASQYQNEIAKLKKNLQDQRMDDLENSKNDENKINQIKEALKAKFSDKLQQMQNELNDTVQQINEKHDDDIKALQKKIDQLHEKNKALKQELYDKNGTIDSFQNEQDKEINGLKGKVSKLSDQNRQQEAELAKRQKAINALQLENEQLIVDNNKASKELLYANKKLAKLQNDFNSHLAEANDQSVSGQDELKDTISELSDLIQEKENEISKEQDKLNSTKRELKKALAENSDLQKTNSNLEEKLKEKDFELEQKQQNIDSLADKFSKLSARQNKFKDSVSQYSLQADQKDKEIAKLEKKIQDLEDRNQQLESGLKEQSKKNAKLNDDLQNSEMKQQIINDLQNNGQNLNATINKLQDQLRLKDQEIENKQKTIDSFEEENNERTNMNTKLQSTLLQTREQLRQKEKELMNLKQNLEDQQSQTIKQLSDINSLQDQLSQIPLIQSEKNEAQKRLIDLEKQNQELRGKINELQITTHEARQQLNQIKALTQVAPSKDDLSKKIQSLLKENTDLKLKNSQLQGQVQSYQDEVSTLKHSFDATSSQFKEKSKTLDNIKEKLNTSQEVMNDTQLKIDDLNDKCSEYESSLKTLAKKYQQKEKQISSHKKAKNDMRRKLQTSEEANQRLSASLSNVNDELNNLKDEIQRKNEIIAQVKDDLENQAASTRDLSATQRALNEKSSMLNNSEDRNASLMREIEKSEQKICQLSDSILEKEKEIKSLKQAQLTQSTQNETLTALTQEQKRQLDEAHQDLLKLQEDLLRVQNEALAKGESIKAITIGQNREMEGRKQIQALIDEDREKYREKITKLHEENSSLSVEKSDFQHKIDQALFENKTLSQLLEAKENELLFERERGAQDLKSTREMAAKIIEENKQLKQQLKDREQFEKQIMMQIQEHIPKAQNLEEVPELAKKMQKTNDDLINVCNTLKISDPSQISSEIKRTLEMDEKLKEQENKLSALFPDTNQKDIIGIIGNMKRENAELQGIQNKLQQIMNSEDLPKSAQMLLSSLKGFQKRENDLSKLVPDYAFERLISDVTHLIRENQDYSKILNLIGSLTGISILSNLPNAVSELINKLNNYSSIEKQTRQIIPISTIDDLPPYLQKLLKSNEEYQLEHNKICGVMPSDIDGDLPQKLSAIIQENLENKALIKNIMSGLPSEIINSNNIADVVSQIAHENEELKKQHKNILNTHLNNALQKNKELLKERNMIASKLSCSEFDNLPDKVDLLFQNNEKLKKTMDDACCLLPNYSKQKNVSNYDLPTELKKYVNELKAAQNHLNEIFSIVKNNNTTHDSNSEDDSFINQSSFNSDNKYKQNNEIEGKEIVRAVQDLANEKSILSQRLNEINSFLPSNNDDIVNNARKELANKEKLTKQIKSIKALFPNSIISLQEDVEDLIKNNQDQQQKLQMIEKILPKGEDDIISKTEQTMKENKKMKNVLNELNDLINSNDDEIGALKNNKVSRNDEIDEITSRAKRVMKQKKNIEKILADVDSILPSDEGNEEDKLTDKTKKVVNRKKKLEAIIQRIESILPPEIGQEDDISVKIGNIIDQKAELEKMLDDFNRSLSDNGKENKGKTKNSNLYNAKSKSQQLINQKKKLEDIISQIDTVLPPGEGDIINRAKEIIKNKKNVDKLLAEVDGIIPLSNEADSQIGIKEKAKKVVNQKKGLDDLLNMVYSILQTGDKEEGEIVDKAKRIVDKKKELEKLISTIDTILPNLSNNNVKNDINKTRKEDNKQLVEKAQKIVQAKKELEKLVDDIGIILSNINQKGNNEDLRKKATEIVKEKKDLDKLFSEINLILTNIDNDNEDENDLLAKTNKIVQTKTDLENMINEIDSILNEGNFEEEEEEDITTIEKAQNIVGQKRDLEKQLADIGLILTNSTGDYEEMKDGAQKLVEDNRNFEKLLSTVNSILGNDQSDPNDIAEKAEKIIQERNELEKLFAEVASLIPNATENENNERIKKEDIISRIKKGYSDFDKTDKLIDQLIRIIPKCDSEKLILPRVQSLVNALKDISTITKIDKEQNPDINVENESKFNPKSKSKSGKQIKYELDSKQNNKSLSPNFKATSLKKNSSHKKENQDTNEIDEETVVENVNIMKANKEQMNSIIEKIKDLFDMPEGNEKLLDKLKEEKDIKTELENQIKEIKDLYEKSKYEKGDNDDRNYYNKKGEKDFTLKLIGNKKLISKSEKPSKSYTLKNNNNKNSNYNSEEDDKKKTMKTYEQLKSEIINGLSHQAKMENALESIFKLVYNNDPSNSSAFVSSDNFDPIIKEIQSHLDLINQIDSLLPQTSNDEENLGIIQRLQEELDQKENSIRKLTSIQSIIPGAKSVDDIQNNLLNLINKNEQIKDTIQNISNILPKQVGKINKKEFEEEEFEEEEVEEEEEEERIITQAKNTVNELNSLKNLVDEIRSTMQSCLNNYTEEEEEEEGFELFSSNKNIVRQLKNIINDKEKLNEQVMKMKSLLPETEDQNELPQRLQETLHQNEKLRHLIGSGLMLIDKAINEEKDKEKPESKNQAKNSKLQFKNSKSSLTESGNVIGNEIRESELIPKIEELIRNKEEIKKELKEIEGMIPNRQNIKNENIRMRLQKEIENKERKEEGIKKIEEILGIDTENGTEGKGVKIGKGEKEGKDERMNVIFKVIEEMKKEMEEMRSILIDEIEKDTKLKDNLEKSKIKNASISKNKNKNTSLFNKSTREERCIDLVQKVLSCKHEVEEILDNINSLLSKSKTKDPNLVSKIKNELSNKEKTEQQLEKIKSLFPDSQTAEDLVQHISELQEFNNISKNKLSSIFQDDESENGEIETKAQKVVDQKKELENVISEIESYFPKGKKQENLLTRIMKEKKKNEDNANFIGKLYDIFPNCDDEQDLENHVISMVDALKSISEIADKEKDERKQENIQKIPMRENPKRNVSKANNFKSQEIYDEEENETESEGNLMNNEEIVNEIRNLKNEKDKMKKSLEDMKQALFLYNKEGISEENIHSFDDVIELLKKEQKIKSELENQLNEIKFLFAANQQETQTQRKNDTYLKEKTNTNKKGKSSKNTNNEGSISNDELKEKILSMFSHVSKADEAIDSIFTLFKESDNKPINKLNKKKNSPNSYDGSQMNNDEILNEEETKIKAEIDNDNYEPLISKIKSFLDRSSENLKCLQDTIDIILPKKQKNNQKDDIDLIKKEITKNKKAQELNDAIFSLMPEIKSPEMLFEKIQNLIKSNEHNQQILDQFDKVLPEKLEDVLKQTDKKKPNIINSDIEEEDYEEDDINEEITKNKKLLKRAKNIVNQNSLLKNMLSNINSLASDSPDKDDLLTKLKKEFKNKENMQKQIEKINSMLNPNSTDSLSLNEIAEALKNIIDNNEEMNRICSECDSILPHLETEKEPIVVDSSDENEYDNVDENISYKNLPLKARIIVQQKDNILQTINEIDTLLPKPKPVKKSQKQILQKQPKMIDNDRGDIVDRLKGELDKKEKAEKFLDEIKSLLNVHDRNELDDRIKSLLKEENDAKQVIEELSSSLAANEDEIIPKVQQIVKEKEEMKKLIDDVESLLPKTKTKENLISRLKKEFKKNSETKKQLEDMNSLIPNTDSPTDLANFIQKLQNENNELKQKIEEIGESVYKENPDENEDIPNMVKSMVSENNLLSQQLNEISSVFSNTSPKTGKQLVPNENLVDRIKNQMKKNQNMQKDINNLMALIPSANSPDELYNSFIEILDENSQLIEEIELIKKFLPKESRLTNQSNKKKESEKLEEEEEMTENENNEEEEEETVLHIRVKNVVDENENLTKTMSTIESLLPRSSKSKGNIIDKIKNELKSKEKIQDQLEKMNNLISSSKPSNSLNINNPTSYLQEILSENARLVQIIMECIQTIDNDKNEEGKQAIKIKSTSIKKISKQLTENIEIEEEEEEDFGNGEFDGSELIEKVEELIRNKEEIKKELKEIEGMIPNKQNIKNENIRMRLQKEIENKERKEEGIKKIEEILGIDTENGTEGKGVKIGKGEKEGKDERMNVIFKVIEEMKKEMEEMRSILIDEIDSDNKKQRFEKNTDKSDSEEDERHVLSLLNEVIDHKLQDENVINKIDSLIPQYESANNSPGSLSRTSPKSKEADTKSRKTKLTKSSNLRNLVQKESNSKSPENLNKNGNGDIVKRIELLLKEYYEIKSHVSKIKTILPQTQSSDDDISSRIEDFVNEKKELDDQMSDLRSFFPLSKSQDDFKINIKGLIQETESLSNLKDQVSNLLTITEDKDGKEPGQSHTIEQDITSRLRRIMNEKEEICQLLGVSDNIKTAVEIMIKENEKLKAENSEFHSILGQERALLNCDSNDELVKTISEMKSTIQSSSELFLKLLEIFAGPMKTPVTLHLPLSQQIKERLWTILTNMKNKMKETDDKIVEIMSKAKRAGFNGIDAVDAVKYLEDSAQLYEQQRVNETFHGQVSNLRELVNEQHKTYETSKYKYKTQTKEHKALISEIQEKYSLREEQLNRENEEFQKQIISLKEDLEKTNKIKTELLRMACGQPADVEFLRANLNRTENSLLGNAEKIRNLVSTIQEKGTKTQNIVRVVRKNKDEKLPPRQVSKPNQ